MNVLFVCTANQFRSPIAALFFSRVVSHEDDCGDWIVGSAGTWTKAGLLAPPVTVRVAEIFGLEDIDTHTTRQIDNDLIKAYQLVVVMENNQKEAILTEFPDVAGRVYTLAELATGLTYDVPDPAFPGVDPEDVGRELKGLIDRGKKRIMELARCAAGA